MIQKIAQEHGRIDILVNNAGLGANHPATKVTEEDWDTMMDVNLKGDSFLLPGYGQDYAGAGLWANH